MRWKPDAYEQKNYIGRAASFLIFEVLKFRHIYVGAVVEKCRQNVEFNWNSFQNNGTTGYFILYITYLTGPDVLKLKILANM